jgi:hypothetical protein
MPSAAAATAGFTQAPDIGFTNLLKAAGHNVTRIVGSATPDVNQLNGFDVVMISRSNASGNFGPEPAETAAWSSITKPIIHLGGYAIRGGTTFPDTNSRLGYTTGSTIPDAQGETKLTINQPNNLIFTGVKRTAGNVMIDNYSSRIILPVAPATLQNGISVNTNALPAGATLLASLPSITTATPAGQVGMFIAEYPQGTALSSEGMDVQSGRRLVFLAGSREAGVTSEAAGIYDLSPIGATMFLNAVNYLTNQPAVIPADVNGSGVADINDYNIIRNNFNKPGTRAQGDLSNDGLVSFADFRHWKNYRSDVGVGSDAELLAGLGVPEPSSILLTMFGAVALAGRVARRGRR